MVAMVLKAWIRERSGLEPRFCQRPKEEDKKSAEPPLGLEITVERPPSARGGFEGPPTGTGSLSADSLANVRHSEVSSME
uniref:Transcription initiation factor IIB isoform X3 n=1 Tax=Rhizophora mucronata TaxID=61149 RepID=A0A2P2L1A4_RHIMU